MNDKHNSYKPYQQKSDNIYQKRDNSSNSNLLPVPSYDSPELLGKDAEDLARKIAYNKELTITQVRNFYNEVKQIQRLLSVNESRWEELYGRVKLLKAKVVYNRSRKKELENFEKFISECVDRIKKDGDGIKNFEIFAQLFEAVLGYAMPYLKK